MDVIIPIIRIPFGLLASCILLAWTFIIVILFCICFFFVAVFAHRRAVETHLLPWFKKTEGTQLFPVVWKWVFDSTSGLE